MPVMRLWYIAWLPCFSRESANWHRCHNVLISAFGIRCFGSFVALRMIRGMRWCPPWDSTRKRPIPGTFSHTWTQNMKRLPQLAMLPWALELCLCQPGELSQIPLSFWIFVPYVSNEKNLLHLLSLMCYTVSMLRRNIKGFRKSSPKTSLRGTCPPR